MVKVVIIKDFFIQVLEVGVGRGTVLSHLADQILRGKGGGGSV